MSWDDGFWHKDNRESPGKAGSSPEVDQDNPKTLGEAREGVGTYRKYDRSNHDSTRSP